MNDLLLPLGAAALFGAFLLVLIPLTRPYVRRRHLAQELSGVPNESARSQLSGLGARATDLADRALTRHDQDRMLGSALERAGMDIRPAEFAVVVVTSAVGAAFVGAFLGGLVGGRRLWCGGVRRVRHRAARQGEAAAEALRRAAAGLALAARGWAPGRAQPAAGARRARAGVALADSRRVPAGALRDPARSSASRRAPCARRAHRQRRLRVGRAGDRDPDATSVATSRRCSTT